MNSGSYPVTAQGYSSITPAPCDPNNPYANCNVAPQITYGGVPAGTNCDPNVPGSCNTDQTATAYNGCDPTDAMSPCYNGPAVANNVYNSGSVPQTAYNVDSSRPCHANDPTCNGIRTNSGAYGSPAPAPVGAYSNCDPNNPSSCNTGPSGPVGGSYGSAPCNPNDPTSSCYVAPTNYENPAPQSGYWTSNVPQPQPSYGTATVATPASSFVTSLPTYGQPDPRASYGPAPATGGCDSNVPSSCNTGPSVPTGSYPAPQPVAYGQTNTNTFYGPASTVTNAPQSTGYGIPDPNASYGPAPVQHTGYGSHSQSSGSYGNTNCNSDDPSSCNTGPSLPTGVQTEYGQPDPRASYGPAPVPSACDPDNPSSCNTGPSLPVEQTGYPGPVPGGYPGPAPAPVGYPQPSYGPAPLPCNPNDPTSACYQPVTVYSHIACMRTTLCSHQRQLRAAPIQTVMAVQYNRVLATASIHCLLRLILHPMDYRLRPE